MNDPFKLLELSNLVEDAEFIPLVSNEDEEEMNSEMIPDELPVLPLRNTVLFPGVVMPITVGRDKSIKLVKEANEKSKIIGVVSQTDPNNEEPKAKDLNRTGTLAKIIKYLRMPDGTITIIIQGKRRFEVEAWTGEDPYFTARVKALPEVKPEILDKKFTALIGSIKELAAKIIEQSPEIPTEANVAIKNIESSNFLINFISSNMNADFSLKQSILEENSLEARAQKVLTNLSKELEMLELKNDIQSKVKVDIDKQQREYFLQQQMKTIQEELGGNPHEAEMEEMRKKAEKKKWSKEVGETFNKELDKLGRMNPAAMEYNVQLNYLETILELPWNEYSKDNFDLKRARKIMDRDHFGSSKVKERIIEHLAVLKLKGDMKSPILCLAGPPGVGKTSLGKSVAEALDRSYVRMSLGGLRDEAEIRGHRKTYIGAMPGRIMQNLKKGGSSNPVFILDEIDKVGASFQGDPASALLEVLDPEQNDSFYDNFVEMDYDLSKVLFIATANDLSSIHPALRDRMEIIQIPGYTVEEKIQIAKKHLIPKLLKDHGLKRGNINLGKSELSLIIESYTREAGVRTLEKRIASLVRKIATQVAMDEEFEPKLTKTEIEKHLGPGHSKDKYERSAIPGVVTGLAWTPVGGDILFIESSVSPGKSKLTLTGSLGDVMKESAVIALEYIRSHAEEFGLKPEIFDNYNVHIHVPEGATPKDGPSAGITMLTSLVSVFTQRLVKPNIAMTGEITLRGKVLPVGGIKEKILAAKRAKVKEIILCQDNRKDVEDIEADYIKGLKFHYVDTMSEVLELSLIKSKVKGAKSFN